MLIEQVRFESHPSSLFKQPHVTITNHHTAQALIHLSSSNFKKTIWRSNNLSSAILIRTDLTDSEGWKGGAGDL